MKSIVMSFVLSAFIGGTAIAQETKTSASDKAVSAITGKEKKSRKKKAEMCAECGKPESECECKGHKGKEHTDHKDEKKDEHKH